MTQFMCEGEEERGKKKKIDARNGGCMRTGLLRIKLRIGMQCPRSDTLKKISCVWAGEVAEECQIEPRIRNGFLDWIKYWSGKQDEDVLAQSQRSHINPSLAPRG